MSTPKLFLLADYPGGVAIARYLKEQGETIVGLGIHGKEVEGPINRGCTEEILRILNLPADRVFHCADIDSGSALPTIKALKPDIALSLFWSKILKPEFLEIPRRTYNLHLSFLPYNRGANPNAWAIVDGTPAGVTIHAVDPGADTGAILAQREVPVTSIDTGETLYKKLVAEAVSLFTESWSSIRDGNVAEIPQKREAGTSHRRSDFSKLDVIDLDRPTTARAVIDHLRAKTFPPFPAAHFVDRDGKKVNVRVLLTYRDHEEKK